MPADIDIIADLVVTEINTRLPGWGFTANAVRKDAPLYTLEELKTQRVTVLPILRTTAAAGRGGLLETRPRVDVDIRLRTKNDEAANAVLKELSEIVAEHFLGGRVAGLSGCLESESSVVFQTDKMNEQGVFAAAVSLTFLVMRTAR